ncbi:hypothetical protein BU23DRAFT_598930 [Bimuria novae-zelandiae CBS 107.79]|uniref:Uncharacterized protein n=1 Tax=Bimuria novae-zelandiae CBS 107.79 TaxID=1447943 RepID=A0A6A5V8J7_9PLEO|nr:hypothetical protein BU23DRAFT_598930 [Bimuria novae-zelandiae CBS 107.79]
MAPVQAATSVLWWCYEGRKAGWADGGRRHHIQSNRIRRPSYDTTGSSAVLLPHHPHALAFQLTDLAAPLFFPARLSFAMASTDGETPAIIEAGTPATTAAGNRATTDAEYHDTAPIMPNIQNFGLADAYLVPDSFSKKRNKGMMNSPRHSTTWKKTERTRSRLLWDDTPHSCF